MKAFVIATAVTPIMVAVAVAQQPSIKRTPVGSIDFPPGFTFVQKFADEKSASGTNVAYYRKRRAP
jgi:hypothetical protein